MDFFWLCEQFAQPICIIVANDSMKQYTSHLHDGPGSFPIAPFFFLCRLKLKIAPKACGGAKPSPGVSTCA